MTAISIDHRPGYRRRFRITPETRRICCEVEDDFHCMAVVLNHDGERAVRLEADMHRAPWTPCPGAIAELGDVFDDVLLADFPMQGAKRRNCTHLYDLALLAASHASDAQETVFDILVSDPEQGRRRAEIRRNNALVLYWVESGFDVLEPQELAGVNLVNMRDWIETQTTELQESARLLRWANMVANGRTIPLADQSVASDIPPNCYTFQPERAKTAHRIGDIKNFGPGGGEPLAGYRPFR